MATELGKAYVQIIPSARGITGMIQKEMGGEVASAGVSSGKSLGSNLIGALKGAIAAAGIGKAIGAALSEGAALQQSLGGIDTLFKASAEKVVFTGMIDQYFDYKHGELEYRSLRFEHEALDEENYQGNAVVNYTEREIPYTRIIEHKHFEYGTQPKTVITREYPADWKRGDEPYYPINDEKNNTIFTKYQEEAAKNDKVIFCGRLADYKYYDMHVVIERALEVVATEFD